ncbi:MAG: TlpA family protein disulfide reductase [Opitutaceae bacterium]|nr:TlpA family protein disulfide reductase [Opitutaceae bacterium]
MSTRILLTSVFCAFSVAAFAAEAPKGGDPKKAPPPKTPADLAWENFDKVRREPGAKDQARFAKVIDAGIAYITKNPTHGRINDAVREIAFYGNNNIDSKQAALRTSYLSNLRLAVTNERFKDGVTDPVTAALHAVEAAAADAELRAGPTGPLVAALREKLDEMTTVPQTGRFLTERERSYVHLLFALNQPPYAKVEEHLSRMLKHADKGVAGMAQTELNILQARKAPYDLKFTALDGKEVDFAQLRGKVVALYFWQATNRGSVGNFDNLLRIASDYRRKGVELVTVSFDKAEDKDKVLAAIKEKGFKGPVHFDGKGAKNAFAPKLNITGVPALLIFDQKGMLQATMQGLNLTINLPVNQFEGTVKRLTEPAKK